MKKIKTAVILVGGSGLRMRPFTEDMPNVWFLCRANHLCTGFCLG